MTRMHFLGKVLHTIYRTTFRQYRWITRGVLAILAVWIGLILATLTGFQSENPILLRITTNAVVIAAAALATIIIGNLPSAIRAAQSDGK